MRHWPELYRFQLQEQYLDRFETTHGQSRLNLVWGTLLYAAPFWPLSVVGAWRRAEGTRSTWVWGWLGSFYGIYALPEEHGLHYPVLALVPLAALAAVAVVPRWLRVGVAAVVALGFAGLGVLGAFPEVPRVSLVAAMSCGGLAAWLLSRAGPGTLALGSGALAVALNLLLATVAPALGRPLVSPEAIAEGRGQAIGTLEHPGPLRLAAGWGPNVTELWGEAALREAVGQGKLVFAREHVLKAADPAVVSQLAPVVLWRRTRPYLTLGEVIDAWRARDLDRLSETSGLYRRRAGP